MEIDKRAFSSAISKIKDGWVFEEFGNRFLSAVLGHDFIPIGGTKDRGIDGFENVHVEDKKRTKIYQLSTESDYLEKIRDTAEKLNKNGIEFQALTYVTNRKIPKQDALCDLFYDEFDKQLRVYDKVWFENNCNHSQGTIAAYNTFIDSYLHEFNSPGRTHIVSDLNTDPRVFVFLRQQVDRRKSNESIDITLADSLILFVLEGTDPDKGIFKSKSEVFEAIKELIKFEPKLIEETIYQQLDELSKKPGRRIRFHPDVDGYCLPYETRIEIRERNLIDGQLHDTFLEQTEERLSKYLKESETVTRNLSELINETINKIYYDQGLEFSNFILSGNSESSIEKDLSKIISTAVDESHVVTKNKQNVKVALTMTVRDIVYNGTKEQKKYLSSLSNTYMMMFMLQCDPKVATYFHTMASQLNIYVGNSILIPALSEFYLSKTNKRHWTLLYGCYKKGVTLVVNDTIIDELVDHLRRVYNRYFNDYKQLESMYLNDEMETFYIDQILIRAYFYAKSRDRVQSFEDFLDNFISPDFKSAKNDIIEFLKNEFGIQYRSNKSIGVKIDENETQILTSELENKKGDKPNNAEKDVELILTIYGQREKNNETNSTSIFGYKTWWLSKDSLTYKSIAKKLSSKYPVSCYIRPDFLYNYISLAPSKSDVDDLYKELFPAMLGVNLSYHLPKEITDYVTKVLRDHSDKNDKRVKSIIRRLTEDLKANPTIRTRKYVKHFLDEELEKINDSA
ncbi:MAG: hypothetical protein RIC95_10120 [Vicingaceae bacterium]